MERVPTLRFDWLNGWIPLVLLWLVEVGLLALFPRDVVKRQFDQSGWTRRQGTFTVAGKLFSLGCIVVWVLSPLKVGSGRFIAGICLWVLGVAMLVAAMLQFRRTPLNEPATGGLYRVSRHPQIVTLTVSFAGICFAAGSWPALLLLLGSWLLQHPGIVAGRGRACGSMVSPTAPTSRACRDTSCSSREASAWGRRWRGMNALRRENRACVDTHVRRRETHPWHGQRHRRNRSRPRARS
jgi:protein-S-isoprenylcysteine O-methyltransferase Ste14